MLPSTRQSSGAIEACWPAVTTSRVFAIFAFRIAPVALPKSSRGMKVNEARAAMPIGTETIQRQTAFGNRSAASELSAHLMWERYESHGRVRERGTPQDLDWECWAG
jgi:hypothetical protein